MIAPMCRPLGLWLQRTQTSLSTDKLRRRAKCERSRGFWDLITARECGQGPDNRRNLDYRMKKGQQVGDNLVATSGVIAPSVFSPGERKPICVACSGPTRRRVFGR